MNPGSFTLRIPAGITLRTESPLHLAAEVFLPEHIGKNPIALICLPGGGMNRRYFDLRPDDGDTSFSFAAQMTRRGFIVIALDHLGLGDSSRPADGYALTPELIAQANQNVTAEILLRLREGRLAEGQPALPKLRSIGVGHSMGAMLTILQQFHGRQHAGIALLGFSTRGLPQFVPADVRELASDPERARARLVEFARRMFVQPYPVIRSSRGGNEELYGSASADPRGVAALKQATDCLLPVPAFLSMIPGNVAIEAAQIDVPVFIGLGERDMAGSPHEVPCAFPQSRDVTLHILPEAGHSHFLFPSRTLLFDRIERWARALPQ